MSSCLRCSTTGGCYGQYPLDGRLAKGMQHFSTMLKTYSEIHIIFRHKIFYLKHLVLTDIHYPTANVLAHSICLEQEAIAQHCITLLSITAADPKLPNPYETSQKYRCQPAKYQNHIHFVLVTLTAQRHFYKRYQKRFVPRIYQHQRPYKTPTVLLQTNKYCEMSERRKFGAKNR